MIHLQSILYLDHQDKISFSSYDQLKLGFDYDPDLWKDNIWLPGVDFLKKFSAPFITAHIENIIDDNIHHEYLKFLAYRISHELLYKEELTLEDINILEKYKDDIWVKKIFEAVKTWEVQY